MRMRTKVSIVTVVGTGALLLCALAVIIAPRPQTAYAQGTEPSVSIALNTYNGVVDEGESLYAQYTFGYQSVSQQGYDSQQDDLLCDKELHNIEHVAFPDPCFHLSKVYERILVEEGDDKIGAHVPQCEGGGMGGHRSFSRGSGTSKVIRYGNNYTSPNCPVGLYTLEVILMGSDKDEVDSAMVPFEVIAAATRAAATRAAATRAAATRAAATRAAATRAAATRAAATRAAATRAAATSDTQEPPPLDDNQATATPTATATRDPQLPPPVDNNDQATATPTATPTEEGNGGNGGNQQNNNPGTQ